MLSVKCNKNIYILIQFIQTWQYEQWKRQKKLTARQIDSSYFSKRFSRELLINPNRWRKAVGIRSPRILIYLLQLTNSDLILNILLLSYRKQRERVKALLTPIIRIRTHPTSFSTNNLNHFIDCLIRKRLSFRQKRRQTS